MNYTLPKSLAVCGTEYAIRWDFRAALDVCAALSDPELDDAERALALLMILYADFDKLPQQDYEEAIRRALWYLNGGEEERENRPHMQLMDWEQDFPLIVAPVSRILGADVRGMETLHWWSFLSAYMEIGDCTFAHVVGIRAKRAKGQKLSKEERAFYNENRDLIEIKTRYTSEEEALLALWGGGGGK